MTPNGPQKKVQKSRKQTRTAAAKKGTPIRLVPTPVSLPLLDLGLGSYVCIRFPATGPVVEIMSVSEVPGEWAGYLIAGVLAAQASK